MALTQQELEGRLWAAANSLRGPVDAADFKAFIFPLLFYKRISDAWDDEHARAVADFGKDLTPEVEADYHRFRFRHTRGTPVKFTHKDGGFYAPEYALKSRAKKNEKPINIKQFDALPASDATAATLLAS